METGQDTAAEPSFSGLVETWGLHVPCKRRRIPTKFQPEDADALQPPSQELMRLFPFLGSLTCRQFEVLRQCGLQGFPEQQCRHVDITQAASRSRFNTDYVGTVTPKGRKYLTDRCRPILGIEALRLQSIWFPEDVSHKLRHFSNDLLCDLAGNAFEGSRCAAAVLSSVVLMSRGSSPCLPPSFPAAATELDDDLQAVWRAPRVRIRRKSSEDLLHLG